MKLVIRTENGQVDTTVQVLKLSDYNVETIFDRKLYFLIPFYLFNFEKQFPEISQDEKKFPIFQKYVIIRNGEGKRERRMNETLSSKYKRETVENKRKSQNEVRST